jgi:hypothetical protein
VTGNVASARDTIDRPVPESCPKCRWINPGTLSVHFIAHLRRDHGDAFGTAIPLSDPTRAREFFYIAPVLGTSTLWHVLFTDWPTDVARLDRTRYRIAWGRTDGPKEAT